MCLEWPFWLWGLHEPFRLRDVLAMCCALDLNVPLLCLLIFVVHTWLRCLSYDFSKDIGRGRVVHYWMARVIGIVQIEQAWCAWSEVSLDFALWRLFDLNVIRIIHGDCLKVSAFPGLPLEVEVLRIPTLSRLDTCMACWLVNRRPYSLSDEWLCPLVHALPSTNHYDLWILVFLGKRRQKWLVWLLGCDHFMESCSSFHQVVDRHASSNGHQLLILLLVLHSLFSLLYCCYSRLLTKDALRKLQILIVNPSCFLHFGFVVQWVMSEWSGGWWADWFSHWWTCFRWLFYELWCSLHGKLS